MIVKDLLEIRKTEKARVGVIPYIEIGDIDIISKQYELKEKGSVSGGVMAYEGEMFVSTVRPTRGAITTVKEKQCAVSNAFAILKVNSAMCEAKYLFFLLNSKPFLQYLGKNSKGATYSTCSKEDVLAYEVKPVTLNEQRRIVNELETISNMLTLRNQELSLLDELIKARFVELFGDPITNTKCLDTKELKDVLSLKAGDFTAASDISDEPSENNIYPCYGGNGIRGYVAEYNQEGEYSLVGRQGALSGNVQYAKGKFKNIEHALLVTPIIEMNSIWLKQLLINLDLKRYQTGAA